VERRGVMNAPKNGKSRAKRIAHVMGAEIAGKVSQTGGGAFGAARIAEAVSTLRQRLQPSRGKRPGRPTSKNRRSRLKVPMSARTRKKLRRLAERMSTAERKLSPMQVAAQLLEEALAGCPDD
ncbi:MAG: hypothetical protein ACPMAQ_07450, partial [Phycisphaerae bacterium]